MLLDEKNQLQAEVDDLRTLHLEEVQKSNQLQAVVDKNARDKVHADAQATRSEADMKRALEKIKRYKVTFSITIMRILTIIWYLNKNRGWVFTTMYISLSPG